MNGKKIEWKEKKIMLAPLKLNILMAIGWGGDVCCKGLFTWIIIFFHNWNILNDIMTFSMRD